MFRKLIYIALMLTFCLSMSARAATIIWVSDNKSPTDGVAADQGWVDLLEANGYTVDLSFRNAEGRTLDDAKIEALNAADLIIISRDANSGDYDDGEEVTQWNSITRPIMMQIAHIMRSNRWRWLDTTNTAGGTPALQVVDPSHPIFNGVSLDADNQVAIVEEQGSSITNHTDPGNGTLLGAKADDGGVWIVEWQAEQEFYPGSGQFAAAQRMWFAAGGTSPDGTYNLTAEGEKLFLNAVAYLLGASMRTKAYNPTPEDGSIYEDTWVSLAWSAGEFAVSHDIYIGENFEDVNNGTGDTFRVSQDLGMEFLIVGFPGYPYETGLVPGTTYYWRIDEINDADPNSPWKGDVWSFMIPPKTAYTPDPANGAELVNLNVTLSWTSGFGAKLHNVVFGDDFEQVSTAPAGIPQGTTSFSPGDLELAKTYYWRVDEFDGADTHIGDVWSFTTEGAVSGPDPANGAIEVKPSVILGWIAGAVAESHEVYFGIDADVVKNATKTSPEYKGAKALGEESYDPGILSLNTEYFWRIDEVNSVNPNSPWAGNVWSFTTGNNFVIDDFEDYDTIDNQIWFSWHDGLGFGAPGTPNFFAGNGTGAAVGDETTASYTEETIVHDGSQAMPISYNNNKQGFAKYSEVELTLSDQRDWTTDDVVELSIWFRGNPASVGSFAEGPVGTYTITAAGSDIWNQADEFHFAYQTLSGPGSIVARVESVENTNNWAKCGVMIRETLEPGSKFAAVYITPTNPDGTATNGCRFQARTDTDAGATSDTSVLATDHEQRGIIAPYWIKLERDVAGNTRGYYSANGSTWTPMEWNPQSIQMSANVYAGLALTSHVSGVAGEAKFSNVTITGNAGAQWMNQDIGIESNDTEPLYVSIANTTGAPAVVVNDDPAAANIDVWTEWVIPLSALADQGIVLTDVDKIAIGIGTQGNMTVPGGKGKMYIDDVRLYQQR